MTVAASGTGAASAAAPPNSVEGGAVVKKGINPELWQACAGPLVNLPVAGTHVVYFPQGHSEQVAASLRKDVDAQIPNYPNLPSKLICLLHSVSLHADPETDEVYAQMTLQPVPSVDKEALLRSDLSLRTSKAQPEFFCKKLTASDTSTHGGFSVPRREAEKIFSPLDYSMTPPAQRIVARDLHDNVWTFRHIYRGKPKRHLLTTGWSLFVSGKRLLAGDSVLFVRDEKQQLLLGIRQANRQLNNLSSSVLSSDSMHIGILAAAAHAAANSSPFTVFYNPRATPSEFVIPLAKYYRAVHGNQISLGMRFRLMCETVESRTRRYMGTITGISDLDPVRWKNSQWRNLQVGWDEAIAGEKRNRVSVWEIEPVTSPFFICPPPYFRSKRPREPGVPDDASDFDNVLKRTMPWLGDDLFMRDSQSLPGLSLVPWMNMQQNPSLVNSMQPNYLPSLSGSFLSNLAGSDVSHFQLGFSAQQIPHPNNLQFNPQKLPQQIQQVNQLPKLPSSTNPAGTVMQLQQQLNDVNQHSRQNMITQTLPSSQVETQILQSQNILESDTLIQQQLSAVQNHQLPGNTTQNLVSQQQQQPKLEQNIMGQIQQQNLVQSQLPDQVNQNLQIPDNQIQRLQLLQKLQQQQQALVAQQAALQQQPAQLALLQGPHRHLIDGSQSLSRSVTPSQMLEMPQAASTSLLQSNIISQQTTKGNNSQDVRFSHLPQQTKLQNQQTSMLSELSGCVGLFPNLTTNQPQNLTTNELGSTLTTNDAPCSTSLSKNNRPISVQPMVNNQSNRSMAMGDDLVQSNSMLLNPSAQETMVSVATLVKESRQKCEVKPSLNISKGQNHGFLAPQSYMNGATGQTDYFDTSSSTTSVCISQNDAHVQQNNNSFSYSPHSIMVREPGQEGEVRAGMRSDVQYGSDDDGHLGMPINSGSVLSKGIVGSGKDFSNNLASECMLDHYGNSKDAQQELSSSMVSQSFGVPDMTFNSIDSVDDQGFTNGVAWVPPPQFQRMRTYTKVYKRGAVGRSIDITRYSGYDELKQDLARRFGIEGQLEDRGRIGWKLVYVDHENDVLLVGDDPWEEFVNCVRCIRILSPQEIQQMSLEGV